MTRASHEKNITDAPASGDPAPAPEIGAQPAEKFDRPRLLEVSGALVNSLDRRHRAKVFRSSKHDRTRLAYARALVAAIQAHNSVLRDLEIEELDRRVRDLEESKK